MKRKVLVVDDSMLARRLTRKILEELDCEVDEASDGASALEQYALNSYDLVVLDLVMHGMYGMEVLTKLKELNPNVPVIIATADIQRSTREQAKQTGAAAMVNKPLNLEEVQEVITAISNGGCAWN